MGLYYKDLMQHLPEVWHVMLHEDKVEITISELFCFLWVLIQVNLHNTMLFQ